MTRPEQGTDSGPGPSQSFKMLISLAQDVPLSEGGGRGKEKSCGRDWLLQGRSCRFLHSTLEWKCRPYKLCEIFETESGSQMFSQ